MLRKLIQPYSFFITLKATYFPLFPSTISGLRTCTKHFHPKSNGRALLGLLINITSLQNKHHLDLGTCLLYLTRLLEDAMLCMFSVCRKSRSDGLNFEVVFKISDALFFFLFSFFTKQAMTICTTSRARGLIVSIFFIAFVVRVPNFCELRFRTIQEDISNGTHNMSRPKLTVEWHYDVYDNAIYSFIVPGTLAGLLPLLALLGLNARLVVEIRRSTRYLR